MKDENIYQLYDYLKGLKDAGLGLRDLDELTFNPWGFVKQFMKEGVKKTFERSLYTFLNEELGGEEAWKRKYEELVEIGKGKKRGEEKYLHTFSENIHQFANLLRGVDVDKILRKPIFDAFSGVWEEEYGRFGYSGIMKPSRDYIMNEIRRVEPVIQKKEKDQWIPLVSAITKEFINKVSPILSKSEELLKGKKDEYNLSEKDLPNKEDILNILRENYKNEGGLPSNKIEGDWHDEINAIIEDHITPIILKRKTSESVNESAS
jgi:hypothetical protein